MTLDGFGAALTVVVVEIPFSDIPRLPKLEV